MEKPEDVKHEDMKHEESLLMFHAFPCPSIRIQNFALFRSRL